MNTSKVLREEIERRRASHVKYVLCSDEDIACEIEEERNKSKEAEKTNAKVEALEAIFDKQVDTLVKRGYPEAVRRASDRNDEKFFSCLAALRLMLKTVAPLLQEEKISDQGSQIPLLIVVRKQLVSLQDQIARIQWKGQSGTDAIGADQLRSPRAISGYGPCYLLVDARIEDLTASRSSYNIRKEIKKQGRFALTIEEGVALVTHYPGILEKGPLALLVSRFFSYVYNPYSDSDAFNFPALDVAYNGRPRLTKLKERDIVGGNAIILSAAKRVVNESDRKGA